MYISHGQVESSMVVEMFEDMLDQDLVDLNKTKKFAGEIAEQEQIKKKLK